MAYLIGNSAKITTTIGKGNLEEFKARQACKSPQELGEYATTKQLEDCVKAKLLKTTPARNYSELVQKQKDAPPGTSVASDQEWSEAWKAHQIENSRKKSPREDHSDPSPLLLDKISALSPSSTKRRALENFKNTLDGSASNIGDGLDNVTRESHKEIRRLAKQSDMIRSILNEQLPSGNNVEGSEENQQVSNLQSWRPYFTNAARPISDAIGSHADIDHAVAGNATGPASFLPLSHHSHLDRILPHMTNELEGVHKTRQLEFMHHLPSKVAGSLRHLATALDSVLSVPFDLLSDVYNGLRRLIDEIADLIDAVVGEIVDFIIGFIGGLMDSIFPEGILDELCAAIDYISSELSDVFDLLGGFPAVSAIGGFLSGITGGLTGFINGVTNLANLLSSGNRALSFISGGRYECTAEQLGLNKLGKLANTALGVLRVTSAIGSLVGGAGNMLGNLGSMIKKTVRGYLSQITTSIRNLASLLANILPMGIGYILDRMLARLCNVGMVGNQGYSIGDTFKSAKDDAFNIALQQFTTHTAILGPLFGKQTTKAQTWAQEASLGSFENSRYVRGAQGNKGVTMVGPGGSLSYRPFGLFQRATGISYESASIGNPVQNQMRLASQIGGGQNISFLKQATAISNAAAKISSFGSSINPINTFIRF